MSARPVYLPKDPEARARLAEFAGLTGEERAAIEWWCAEQAREDADRQRRGLEACGDEPMAAGGGTPAPSEREP